MTDDTSSRITTGIRVGTVAAAATIGAVIGLGLRHGLALSPFVSAGGAILGKLGIDATASVTTFVGLAAVASAIIVLGVCFTVVAAPLRGLRLLGVAIVFGAIAWAVSGFVVPSILASSAGAVLGDAQRVFVFAMLTIALVVGMRLARSRTRID
jgi:hypothetical protein